jgi:hypothetical protein
VRKRCEHMELGVVRRNKRGQCYLCVNAAQREMYAANRDRYQQHALKYHHENKEAANQKSRKWHEANKEHASTKNAQWRTEHPERTRDKGIVFAEGETIGGFMTAQNARCAICNADFSVLKSKQIHVDHDHSMPGRPNIRGLLCNHCNIGLGHFKDDIRRLQAAIGYLTQFQMKAVG